VLDEAIQNEIIGATEALWRDKCGGPELAAYLSRKKEKGHGLADWVEEQTTDMLEEHFADGATHQLDAKGKGGARRARSMGDIWIECGGIFNPVNIKTGVKGRAGSTGQPNLVSLNKLTEAVCKRWIDSYYLLFVHFIDESPPTSVVAVADLLHIAAEYAHFDSGTGQFMLKAGKYDDPPPPSYSAADLQEAVDQLLAIREDGNERLFRVRAEKLEDIKKMVADFDRDAPIDQGALLLDSAS
jgi:hypothetical protein